MKKVNRILSMLLVLAMLFSLSITAMAAEATLTGSITLKDSATVSVSNKTFKAYKILDATFVDNKGPQDSDQFQGVAYTVPDEMAAFYESRYGLSKDAVDFGQQVAAKIKAEPDHFAFARAALAAAKEKGVAPGTATAGDSVTSVTINNLPFGYYVIEDAGAAAPISALLLDTVGKVEVSIKADKPTIEKKIDGDNDKDPSTNGNVDTNNAAIGDKVPYVVTSKVPDMTGNTKYFFVVTDTLSKGLTFNKDVVITIGGETIDPGQYTVTSTGGNGEPTAIEIVFKNFIQYQPKKGQDIVITYSATLNEHAVIGVEGNPNKVHLEYSNSPSVTPEGDPENPDKPGPGDVIGTTPEEVTKTFVTKLEVLKENEAHEALAGAKFKLEGKRLNTVIITREVFTESKDGTGTYYPLTDGSYTTAKPKEETKNQYIGGMDAKPHTKETKTETVTKTENVVYDGFVDDSGKLVFSGLAAGTYTLTELVAPNGYNMLKDPITIIITCNLPDDATGNATWGVSTDNATVVDGVIKLTVVNTTGTELPSTGGIGTTIFYVIGLTLMFAAVVLLITKKRMAAEN